jgi:hypothetical protein
MGLRPVVGDGLPAEYERWRSPRALVTPVFLGEMQASFRIALNRGLSRKHNIEA